ncbi:MAG TPA: hypothetical protein VNA24_15455 [Hyalangium sp.]|nr:hypothetical protein [Hyalangium sp.]
MDRCSACRRDGLTVNELKEARIATVKQQQVEVLYLFTGTGSVYQLSK